MPCCVVAETFELEMLKFRKGCTQLLKLLVAKHGAALAEMWVNRAAAGGASKKVWEMKLTRKYPRCQTDPRGIRRWSRNERCPCQSSSAWRQFRLQAEWEGLTPEL